MVASMEIDTLACTSKNKIPRGLSSGRKNRLWAR